MKDSVTKVVSDSSTLVAFGDVLGWWWHHHRGAALCGVGCSSV